MLSLQPLSAVGDIFGYKRVYLACLVLFGIASLGCALAPSLLVLTSTRVVQGLGAAGVMSVNMALVRFIHPIHRLGHGIGINAVIIAVSAAAGPTIASSILAFAHWPWLFAIKVPIAIIAVAIGIYALPETPRATHPFDVVSAILSTITFGTLIAFLDGFSRRPAHPQRGGTRAHAGGGICSLPPPTPDASAAAARRSVAHSDVHALHQHVLLFLPWRRPWPSSLCRFISNT